MPLVYSLDRVRRLRLVLRVAAFTGVLLCLLGVFAAVTDDDLRRFALVAGAAGVAVLGSSVVGLRALDGRDGRAKVAALVAGALTVVVGFFFAKAILGFAMIVLGIVIVLLAALNDDPELET